MKEENVQEIYSQAQLGNRIGFGEAPAIVVVDFCVGFTDTARPLGADCSKEISATNRLLDLARTKGFPVVFTTEGYARHLKDDGIWYKKIPSHVSLTLDSGAHELDPRLNYDKNHDSIVLKKGASAFFGTNLVSILVAQGVDTVIITGATTSGCVRATVVDACQYGYRVIVPRECVGDRAQGPHEANLFDIDAKYGDVMALDEVLQKLSGY